MMHVHFNRNVRTKRGAGKTGLCQRRAEFPSKILILMVGNKETIKYFRVANIIIIS